MLKRRVLRFVCPLLSLRSGLFYKHYRKIKLIPCYYNLIKLMKTGKKVYPKLHSFVALVIIHEVILNRHILKLNDGNILYVSQMAYIHTLVF